MSSANSRYKKNRSLTLLYLRPLSCLLLLCCALQSFAQKDSVATKAVELPEPRFDYFRLGVDLSKFLASPLAPAYNAYEFSFDTHYKKDLWLAADFGWGKSRVNNDNIAFNSRNFFLRLGLDKTFFNQEFKGDLDNAFIGLRYGMAYVHRAEATYAIKDTVWGNTSGSVAGADFLAHWIELGAGFRLELVKNIFLGWNIRAKTFVNPSTFKELPPAYIAGYGRGEKNTAFGYNLFLMMGFGDKRVNAKAPMNPQVKGQSKPKASPPPKRRRRNY